MKKKKLFKILIFLAVVFVVSKVFYGDNKAPKLSIVKTGFVVTEDNKKIAFDHYQNDHEKVIVLAHGFYNSKGSVLFRQMAEELSGDYDVISMDFRGHGKSDGPFCWTAKEHQDLEAILEYAKKHYDEIGVIGFSLGAATSIIVASNSDRISSLISVSSPTEFRKVDGLFWKMGIMENIVYNFFQEGRFGKGVFPGSLWLEKTNPIDVVNKIHIPVFFVHGQEDWLILPGHSKELYEKANDKKKLSIIKNVSHAEYVYRSDRKGTMQMFKDWFKETL